MTSPASMPEPAPQEQLFQLAFGYMLSSALNVATRLGIADRLGDDSRDVAELARETKVNEDALFRLLRALASVGVFTETAPRQFALTPMARLLREDSPGTRDMVRWISDPFHFKVYAELQHSIETGVPAVEKVFGMPVFEYFPTDPALSSVFNDAMTSFSAVVIPAVLEVYDFSGIDTLVDVAGGHGHVLISILQKYPKMKGVLGDLAHVLEGAGPKIAEAGVADRCRTEVIDFFKGVPQGGDAYIMKHIIHDWDDERSLTILRHIRGALAGKSAGKVILLDSVLAPANQPDFGKIIDLEMLVMPGGRERTAEEFRSLFSRAGFRMTRIVPTKSPLSVIEAVAE
jgi:hypothetical protein